MSITINAVKAAEIDKRPPYVMPDDLRETVDFINLILSLRVSK